MAESAVASRSLEERERELAATNVAPAITVASEYDRHTETLERGEAEAEDPWAFAGENESIDSFIAGAAPSCTAGALHHQVELQRIICSPRAHAQQ